MEIRKFDRAVLLVTSVLFIPAFSYGASLIWALSLSIFFSVFLKRQFEEIISKCSGSQHKAESSVRVLSSYALLTGEMLLYFMLGPALYILIGLEGTSSLIDNAVLQYSPFMGPEAKDYAELSAYAQWFISASLACVLLIIITAFINRQQLRKLAGLVIFARKYEQDVQDRVRRLVKFSVLFDVLAIACLGGILLVFFASKNFLSKEMFSIGHSFSLLLLTNLVAFISMGAASLALEAWIKRFGSN